MKYNILAKITPSAAVKLLITNEMDLSYFNLDNQINQIWDSLLEISVDEILSIIDNLQICEVAVAKDIPQFGRLDTIDKVPFYFEDSSSLQADYAQLGFYLKKDINATLGANTKFGENHGKGASLLGIVKCKNKKIVPSMLTFSFCELSKEKRYKVLVLLMFRIPIIQILLKISKKRQIDGFGPMVLLSESTKKRRSQCVRKILSILKTLDSQELNERLENILWVLE